MDTGQAERAETVRRGAVIKALREAYGIKADELATLVDVTRRYLSYIEAGDKRAPVVLCRKIADVLGVPLAAITVEGFEDAQQAVRQEPAA